MSKLFQKIYQIADTFRLMRKRRLQRLYHPD
jgi:hypothetical protein